MNILIACEESGVVRDAFRRRGHNAWSCDILPTSTPSDYHYQCDVREVLYQDWDMVIAHPPCTYLTNTGVSWLYKKPGRWEQLKEGGEFFKLFLNLKTEYVAVENPIPHKYALEIIGRKYDQIIQPYQFGHAERKATCLWLKNLPKLQPTKDCKAEMLALPKKESQRLHYLPPSPQRSVLRSKTFKGIAEAMADQWKGNIR